MNRNQFYLRYYGGSRGKFGHEFIEFVIKPNGHFMYINNSHYKNDTVIKRKGYLSATAIQAFKDMIKDSNILTEDDSKWPEPDYKGKQELEICMDGQHVSFTCCKLFSVSDCENSRLLGPRWAPSTLLFGAGSEVFGFRYYERSFQNQTNLKC